MLAILLLTGFSEDDRATGVPLYRLACGDMTEDECIEHFDRQPEARQPEDPQPEARQPIQRLRPQPQQQRVRERVVPRPPESEEARIAREIIEQTNAVRRRAGLHPLQVDPACEKAMVDHVVDMAERNYLSHTGKGETSPSDRYLRYGRPREGAGENIAWNTKGTSEKFMEQWMNSPGHHKNIHRKAYTHIGVAVRKDNCSSWAGCKFYAGQCFSFPKGQRLSGR